MSSFSGGPLTDEEEYLIEKYKILREKKKLLQKVLKEKAETKSKPAVKKDLVSTPNISPEDAKRKAERLVASGCVKISKSSTSREFKRARMSEKKNSKDVLSDQESPIMVEKKQEQSELAATIKEMYTKNFVKSGDGGDQDNSDSKYGHKEYKYNRGYREPKKGNTIFIKGHGLTEEIVRNEFVKFGIVTDIHFEKERRFSFVTYQNADEAEKAIEEMNGTKIVSGYIQVSFARRQYRNERGDSPMWSRGYQPRDRNEKVKEARELQSYGEEDFF